MSVMTRPFAQTREECPTGWFLGFPTQTRVAGSATGGQLGIIEHVLPAGAESPWHVHHAEDESFYLIDGAMVFYCGDETIQATAGTFISLPRDIPHGFRVAESGPARVLLLFAPAGFEGFVNELISPSPPAGPPDIAQVMAVAARYNTEILGPLPNR
jgi:quercetin dioxygenase-like cupin family protein